MPSWCPTNRRPHSTDPFRREDGGGHGSGRDDPPVRITRHRTARMRSPRGRRRRAAAPRVAACRAARRRRP